MKARTIPAWSVLAVMLVLVGCGKSGQMYRGSVDVLLFADASDPLATARSSSNAWLRSQIDLLQSDRVLGGVADELRLDAKWSLPRSGVLQKLRENMYATQILAKMSRVKLEDGTIGGRPADGFVVSFTSRSESECEEVVTAIARAFEREAEEMGSRDIASQLALAEREQQAAQGKLDALAEQMRSMQTNLFVPSGYRLSKEYEDGLQAKIRQATAEESERATQLESLRAMQSGALRASLVKLEQTRLASPAVAGNPDASTSMLLMVHQAQKGAEKELEAARSGVLTETNAVAHAELRLEQANRNLDDTMKAYLQSLEIELEVSKTKRSELVAQLEKLRETARRAEQKEAIEKEGRLLKDRLSELEADVERWKSSQRIVTESIHVGEVNVTPVPAR